MESLRLNLELGECDQAAEVAGRIIRNEWGIRRDGLCLRLEAEATPVIAAAMRRCLEDRYGALVSTSTGPDANGMVWVRAVIAGRALGVFE